jgi:protein-tyrosine phosphatase
VQVSASSITDPRNRRDAAALKSWFQRGIVHLLGSDGHSPRSRSPRMSAAYYQLVRWLGEDRAERIASRNGMAILRGEKIRSPRPQPISRRSWLPRLW